MKRIELILLLSSLFLIIAVANTLHAFENSLPWYRYLIGGGALIASSVTIIVTPKKTKKRDIVYGIISWLFFGLSIPSILFSHPSSLTGALLLIFAVHIYATNIMVNWYVIASMLTAAVISIIARSMFGGWSTAETIKNIAGMTLSGVIYWTFIYPKSKPDPIISQKGLDYETIDIVLRFYKGANRAEIADVLNISPSTVTDKMKKARARMNARSDMELFQKLRQKGDISV